MQDVPVSVTAVTHETLEDAGVRIVSEAAIYAPNTYFNEFTARKLSNPRFRGIGSSPNNPGVTTYIDGVPQLNANSSSIELLDVDQIEFVRGPQSALFGRNTLGGLVNITSAPAVADELDRQRRRARSATSAAATCAARASGPARRRQASPRRRRSATRRRDGFTDQRRHRPRPRLAVGVVRQGAAAVDADRALGSARASFTGERARDGDYALNDLGRAARQPVPRRRATSRATPIATSSRRPSSVTHAGRSRRCSRPRPGS